jgi:methionyl-tRNA formyltransferase
MRIAVFCATERGLTCLRHIRQLCPGDQLSVVTFREEPVEPPFFDSIRDFALSVGAEFHEARTVGEEQADRLAADGLDLIVTVSWRYILSARLRGLARVAAVGLHDSLLPRYRGFSPTVWAMVNGERECGATLFHLADGMDAGDVVAQRVIPIRRDDTIGSVMPRVTRTYVELLEENLVALTRNAAPRAAQDHSRATYTCRRLPDDNRISWTSSAEQIVNLVRAVSQPYPGAFTELSGSRLTIWEAVHRNWERRYVGAVPGRVVEIQRDRGVTVLTGDGAVMLKTVKRAGAAPTCAADEIRSLSTTLR